MKKGFGDLTFSLIPKSKKTFTALFSGVKDKSYPSLHQYLLDEITEEDISSKLLVRQKLESLVKLEWMYYHDQRRKKIRSLKNAFNKCLIPGGLEFTNYNRCVTSKYQNMPLSSKGSLIAHKGGRFNIGKLSAQFEAFPGFYIASNAETALSEAFQTDITKRLKYSPDSFALGHGQKSHSIVRVHGQLARVINLNSDQNLGRIVKVFKKIAPSPEVLQLAQTLALPPRGSVTSIKQLSDQLFDRNWSYYPSNFGLPHNSQDFGALAREAGVQGLVYDSKYGHGKCIVIFPENIQHCPTSFIQLSDEFPEGTILRIDQNNFSDSYL